ncbi:MAG TPA: MFS transporter [Blastocatellia bacterium]|nr:MFS transporter [Blastocatellia bacterium]
MNDEQVPVADFIVPRSYFIVMLSKSSKPFAAARDYLGLNRNVAVLALSIFGLGLGEELWQSYLPKYLAALGGSGVVVGFFASGRDLLDGLYQYPGGWINDRFGRRRALMLFTLVAMGGYALYAVAWHWAVVFVGLVLVMAWKAGAFPATFAVIGDALPEGQRAMAFSVQSILVRVPRVVGAPLGGLLIASLGVTRGVQVAAGVTLLLALAVLITQQRGYRERAVAAGSYERTPVRQIFARMPATLKRLLLAECLVRFGEAIAAAFIVLYVINVLGYSAPTYGTLYALQQTVALVMYLPSGRLADLSGRRPLIALTFLFFALFPLAVQWSHSFIALVAAFVVGGLKEMGEPARKAFIVDLSDPAQRGRAVGVYYTIRNLLVVPAGTLGGLLWSHAPQLPLRVAGAVGMLGVIVFWLTSREQNIKGAEQNHA